MLRRLAAVLLALPALAQQAPKVSTIPPVPLVIVDRGAQTANFDLLIENSSDRKLEITTIEMSAFAADGTFIWQQRVQPNGMSILTVPKRFVEPKGRLVVFNPFPSIPDDLKFDTLRYAVVFGDGAENDEVHRVGLEVKPLRFAQKTTLELPVGGRVFVHDGHDLLAHHRRLDLTGDMTTALNIQSNMTRYAYDFVQIDKQGRMRKGEAEQPSDWYCFGTPVFAPGDGVVVKMNDGVQDNSPSYRWRPDMQTVMKDVLLIGGNHVMIDHGNGEFSWLAHLKQGSVGVKVGDRVKRGQKLGEVGNSGDSMFPHLHYQLQSDNYLGEGLPSYFMNYQRIVGGKPLDVKRGHVDTGDVLVVKK